MWTTLKKRCPHAHSPNKCKCQPRNNIDRKQRSLNLIAHIIRKRRDNPPTDSPEEAINEAEGRVPWPSARNAPAPVDTIKSLFRCGARQKLRRRQSEDAACAATAVAPLHGQDPLRTSHPYFEILAKEAKWPICCRRFRLPPPCRNTNDSARLHALCLQHRCRRWGC